MARPWDILVVALFNLVKGVLTWKSFEREAGLVAGEKAVTALISRAKKKIGCLMVVFLVVVVVVPVTVRVPFNIQLQPGTYIQN
mmetsp:Transcript_7862/g.11370  ORF Transcript_7862/g.11370 Transcript_7862/m.11370 type:complete len:84 (-) Transcript_7862:35-286(-)